jgi:hypothetical protein
MLRRVAADFDGPGGWAAPATAYGSHCRFGRSVDVKL